jgi:hypothetical protein
MKRLSVCLIASCLCVVVATGAVAQADMGLKGIGAKLGYVGPEDVDATIGFGVSANLGTIAPRFMLELNAGFWSASEEPFPGNEFSVQDISFGAKGKYMFPVKKSQVNPFVGGGLGLHFVSAELTSGGVSTDDSEVKLGLDFGGGLLFPMNPQWDLMTELWYGVVSDVNQVSFIVGVEYNLGSGGKVGSTEKMGTSKKSRRK